MSASGCSAPYGTDAVGTVARLKPSEQLALGEQHDGHELQADGEDHDRLQDLDPPFFVEADRGEEGRAAHTSCSRVG